MTTRTLIPITLLLALLLGACITALGSGTPTFGAPGEPTPTPFLPMTSIQDAQVKSVSLPTDGAMLLAGTVEEEPEVVPDPWGDFLSPSQLSDIAIPAPMTTFAQPENQVTILVMGSDQRPNDGGFRTDVNMLVVLNREDGTVNLLSFPRDLYVYQPGWRMDRINTAQQRGGFEMSADTFEYNFGVRPDHYVLINFAGFVNIVDALGGVYVNVPQTLCDERDGPGDYCAYAGSFYMDGETALWYVRSRGTSSDFDRARRQQEVIQAIFYRLLSLDGITNAPALWEQYQQTVSTDMGWTDILPLLPFASAIGDSGAITRYVIGSEDVISYRTANGAAVLLPDSEAVRAIMAEALNIP